MPTSRVQLIPLFKGLAVSTDGTAQSPTTLELDVTAVKSVLPYCEALFLIGMTEGVTLGQVEWNVQFLSGFDRSHQFSTAINIAATHFGAIVTQRSADYVTTTNFMQDTRLKVWWQNASAVSGVKTPILSATLGIRYYA